MDVYFSHQEIDGAAQPEKPFHFSFHVCFLCRQCSVLLQLLTKYMSIYTGTYIVALYPTSVHVSSFPTSRPLGRWSMEVRNHLANVSPHKKRNNEDNRKRSSGEWSHRMNRSSLPNMHLNMQAMRDTCLLCFHSATNHNLHHKLICVCVCSLWVRCTMLHVLPLASNSVTLLLVYFLWFPKTVHGSPYMVLPGVSIAYMGNWSDVGYITGQMGKNCQTLAL